MCERHGTSCGHENVRAHIGQQSNRSTAVAARSASAAIATCTATATATVVMARYGLVAARGGPGVGFRRANNGATKPTTQVAGTSGTTGPALLSPCSGSAIRTHQLDCVCQHRCARRGLIVTGKEQGDTVPADSTSSTTTSAASPGAASAAVRVALVR